MSMVEQSSQAGMTGQEAQPEGLQSPCRPRDLATLMLAGPGLRTRQRARDQQSDKAGIELKRQVLSRLAELDPEPNEFDATLERIISEMGPPHGPTRGVCLSIRNDWESACMSPQFIAWLVQEAVSDSAETRRGKRRAD